MINISNDAKNPSLFEINHAQWVNKHQVQSQVSLYTDYQKLYASFKIFEKNPMAKCDEHMMMVCKDSACEFFISFPDDPNDKGFSPLMDKYYYVNFEFNSKGMCYCKYGRHRKSRQAFTLEQIKALNIKTELHDNYWILSFAIPNFIFKDIINYDLFSPNNIFAFNAYKISEDEAIEHYYSAFKVQSPTPNFHVPESFMLAKV